VAELRAQLDERTADLQRTAAEYANYRRRSERDRAAAAEGATALVLATLLPVLDDIERARQHGDLTGAFASVAEQLVQTLTKLGLTAFGEVGDAFDPNLHEAVTHTVSAEVSRPTCVTVMRRGYSLGERLVRPAMVGVAEPELPPAAGPPGGTGGTGSGPDEGGPAANGIASEGGTEVAADDLTAVSDAAFGGTAQH